jgi:hypothetical protein
VSWQPSEGCPSVPSFAFSTTDPSSLDDVANDRTVLGRLGGTRAVKDRDVRSAQSCLEEREWNTGYFSVFRMLWPLAGGKCRLTIVPSTRRRHVEHCPDRAQN